MWLKLAGKFRVLAPTAICLMFTAVGLFTLRQDSEWRQKAEDSIMLVDWSGFGPERGLYNFTVVTAMIDIGRGGWGSQSRTYSTYLLYMQRMLRLDVNMVVYVEVKGKPFVEWMRRGRENHTHIVTMDIRMLPYYQLRDRMAEIMNSEDYKKDNELVEKHLCESNSPEYDIVQLSKLYLLDRTVTTNPFNTTYFIWMDGGYGKGEDIFPPDGIWKPKDLFEYANQMTFLERKPGVMAFANVRDKIYKMSINIMPGGFLAGGGMVIRDVYSRQKQELAVWMEKGIIDDDQTMYMHLYFLKPSMFHLVPGDWYDVFKLFNAHTSS